MEKEMFAALLLSGLCHLASSLHLRQYLFINEPKTWTEAQRFCREKYTDLAAVNDPQDLQELAALTEPGVSSVFVGLHRTWSWSQSDDDDYREGESPYWNWASDEPTDQFCGSVGSTGEWRATNCSRSLNFVCYDSLTSDISQRFVLGEGSMDWFAARASCRERHTDLARVRSRLEDEQLQNVAMNEEVWVGLTRMTWEWSDGREASFTPWSEHKVELDRLGDCAVLDVESDPPRMTDKSCDEELPFFCYSVPLRRITVRLKLTDDSSVDMKDPAVMETIMKLVEKKLRDEGYSGDVKVSWRKFPVKEKRAKPQTYEKKCVP